MQSILLIWAGDRRLSVLLISCLNCLRDCNQSVSPTINHSKIPLTQELLADALGLSIPHVNRVLRRLREDNLVVVEDQRVTVKDIELLSELADFDPGYLSRFPGGELLMG